MLQNILVIDDDEKLNELLKSYLSDFGYKVFSATHPEKGLHLIRAQEPELVILDVMLPDMSGFEVCKRIRQDSDVPVIMLTARGELMDRVVGLELGADDYLPKPFEPRELVARIQTVLRRSVRVDASRVQKYGPLKVDFPRRKAFINDRDIDLSTNEFTALSLLLRNIGKVMDRDQLMQELRGMDADAFNRTVDITMSRLRQKLGDDPKDPMFIKTVWGAGYVFIGENPENEDRTD
ncbi:MAG: response regulator transcription factor [Desulfobacterales bacterium]|nr:response regulator transcription factor [Desulfobacterales bacterium]